MKIFISYSQKDKNIIDSLIGDLKKIRSNEIWYNQELNGGHVWWDNILENIKNCDLFVFGLSQSSIESTACKSELEYARQLRKRILPISVGQDVPANLMPKILATRQYVKYKEKDADSIINLINAFDNLPDPEPLLYPLPQKPPPPISYMDHLHSRINNPTPLTPAEQYELYDQLQTKFDDPDTKKVARQLLKKFSSRADINKRVYDEIEKILSKSNETILPRQSSTRESTQKTAKAGLLNNRIVRIVLIVIAVWIVLAICGSLLSLLSILFSGPYYY